MSLLILMVMLGVMVQLSMTADNAFLSTIQNGGAVDVQLDALDNTFVFFLFGLGITIMAPLDCHADRCWICAKSA